MSPWAFSEKHHLRGGSLKPPLGSGLHLPTAPAPRRRRAVGALGKELPQGEGAWEAAAAAARRRYLQSARAEGS